MSKAILQRFRLQNFKAIRNSKTVKFDSLTVFIGYNGSGKSSLIEGLETFQAIVERGLDEAMQHWRGFEHIWHGGIKSHKPRRPGVDYSNPMSFEIALKDGSDNFRFLMQITMRDDELLIRREEDRHIYYARGDDEIRKKRLNIKTRNSDGKIRYNESEDSDRLVSDENIKSAEPGYSIIPSEAVSDWQFVSLVPQTMGVPIPQKRTRGPIQLAKDGSNIAEYLLNIRDIDQDAFDGILETLQYVLPYARDLQPTITSELERTVYLRLTEQDFKIPGWLFSTGTLRILALLALLRHPHPPKLIVIEEIENGLDPRTIHLIVDEIRNAVEMGRTQVIATTHSPYLLDLLDLSHIVLVERIDGEPVFTRPASQKSLQNWVDRFGPGKLYTMGKLNTGQDS